ncbi:RNase H domain-containing protein [Trichonephila inaurata madagascariensis]|uniref:RNase H domain-containing protein n=1 Tax=Trichonephila inaurata madagascariensis TaxID=2747483 RepID=A0A8X6X2G6_9ARAC|nr:RNase H domain-containing protein [Trichonephila inaurata madagascariensis]
MWKVGLHTSNTYFRKLAEHIDNLRPSNEETNAIINANGHVLVDDWEAAKALAQHNANISSLAFSRSDKHSARVSRNHIKSCRNRPADNPLFNVDFILSELTYTLQNLDTKKSPGPDNIHRHFLSHLGILDRERLLPISLTCITCKIIKSMVLWRLTHNLLTNNLLLPEQFAF